MTTRRLASLQSEAEFQGAVVDFARLHGWLVYHDRDSRRNEPGFPDLGFARDGVFLLAELKTEKGKVSTVRLVTKSGRVLPSQQDWIDASGAELWRPNDWARIEEVLA